MFLELLSCFLVLSAFLVLFADGCGQWLGTPAFAGEQEARVRLNAVRGRSGAGILNLRGRGSLLKSVEPVRLRCPLCSLLTWRILYCKHRASFVAAFALGKQQYQTSEDEVRCRACPKLQSWCIEMDGAKWMMRQRRCRSRASAQERLEALEQRLGKACESYTQELGTDVLPSSARNTWCTTSRDITKEASFLYWMSLIFVQ